MKTILPIVILISTLHAAAQSTPPEFFISYHNTAVSASVRDYGDTIDFQGYNSNTPITDNYWEDGAIFSGHNGSGVPVTYDYGMYSFTSTLHSDDWYNAMKLRIVDVNDTTISKPISHLSFFNPINSEIDYIKVTVYDNQDNEVATYLSTSPEWVSIDVPSNDGAYVVFDDSASTAYVIDLVSFLPGGKPTSAEDSLQLETSVMVYPNPVDKSFVIATNSSNSSGLGEVRIFNSKGMLVRDYHEVNSSSVVLSKSDFFPGLYFYSIGDSVGKTQQGTFIVQ